MTGRTTSLSVAIDLTSSPTPTGSQGAGPKVPARQSQGRFSPRPAGFPDASHKTPVTVHTWDTPGAGGCEPGSVNDDQAHFLGITTFQSSRRSGRRPKRHPSPLEQRPRLPSPQAVPKGTLSSPDSGHGPAPPARLRLRGGGGTGRPGAQHPPQPGSSERPSRRPVGGEMATGRERGAAVTTWPRRASVQWGRRYLLPITPQSPRALSRAPLPSSAALRTREESHSLPQHYCPEDAAGSPASSPRGHVNGSMFNSHWLFSPSSVAAEPPG